MVILDCCVRVPLELTPYTSTLFDPLDAIKMRSDGKRTLLNWAQPDKARAVKNTTNTFVFIQQNLGLIDRDINPLRPPHRIDVSR